MGLAMISVDTSWVAPPPTEPDGPAATPAEAAVPAVTAAPEGRALPEGTAAPNGTFGELPESWFHAHFARLWRLVARLGVAGTSVDDVVQEAFIAAARRRADIAPGREWSFLVGAALRLGWNHRYRASARREVSHEGALEQAASPYPDAEQLLVEKRTRQQLEQALAALNADQREVFVLYELEGFSAPEIAELLALPLGTVASRLGRARARFASAAARLQRACGARREDT
jgi:RNA polymerase sigma-70 factor (ECF subfamily)